MRNHPNFNFELFFAAAKLLRMGGWNVISPAEMDIEAKEPWIVSVSPLVIDTDFAIDDGECRRLIRRDVEAILTLRRANGDAIVLLPDWEDSTGAFSERHTAKWAKIPALQFTFTDRNKDFFLDPIPDQKSPHEDNDE